MSRKQNVDERFMEWLTANLHRLLQPSYSPAVYLLGWHYIAINNYNGN